MSSPAWDDLDDFLDPDDFGVRAVVTLQAGGTITASVLFDEPATGLKFEHRNPVGKAARLGEYEADAENPSMVGRADALARVRRRDGVTLYAACGKRLGSYGVLTGPQPDGNGMARVVLTLEG